MMNYAATIAVAAAMSLGMTAAGEARQGRPHVKGGAVQVHAIPWRDFQAIAPDAGRSPGVGPQGSADSSLGYLRHF